ncbi:hypothetical protein SAMN02799622_02956 [Methylobacterium sp. UNC378MF]|nr:hypothetical protein [Methylobacterium sp. UNC378MF]SDA22532.1 hypothetical protein SAMN02799622_02956 [Methylobacterium sp. UNC378MF]
MSLIPAGLDWQVEPGARAGLAYDGQVGPRAQDRAVKGSFSYEW